MPCRAKRLTQCSMGLTFVWLGSLKSSGAEEKSTRRPCSAMFATQSSA